LADHLHLHGVDPAGGDLRVGGADQAFLDRAVVTGVHIDGVHGGETT